MQDLHLNRQEINNPTEPRISHYCRVFLNIYSFPFGNSEYIAYKDFAYLLLFWLQNSWQIHHAHTHTHIKYNIRLPTALFLRMNSWWLEKKGSNGNKSSDLNLTMHFRDMHGCICYLAKYEWSLCKNKSHRMTT